MCCFSRRVDHVGGTQIFARAADGEREFLVYSMILAAREDLAMILPIPVPKGSADDAVRFINLEKYTEFFAELGRGFPESRGGIPTLAKSADQPKLEVLKVGSYDASFVPTIADFSRLDERFRLPDQVWDQLPAYKDYGFVVFKLRKGKSEVHPMAFEFPRANRQQLFFPTVHVHDGKVHATARFDHTLYCQSSGEEAIVEWEESARPAGLFMKIDRAKGILDAGGHVYRRIIRGQRKNQDILI
jgi:hypothetical protein